MPEPNNQSTDAGFPPNTFSMSDIDGLREAVKRIVGLPMQYPDCPELRAFGRSILRESLKEQK